MADGETLQIVYMNQFVVIFWSIKLLEKSEERFS